MRKQIIILISLAVIAVLCAGGLGYYTKVKQTTQPQMISVIAVEPIVKTIQIPQRECHDVIKSKLVKNPKENFFNHLFDSKNNPKYIKQTSTHKVCDNIMIESQITTGYIAHYQLGNYVESLVVHSPPPLNVTMPLTGLQQYQQMESKVSIQ
ncbi:MAG: hypothetical protein RLZZ293_376 [Pseudomonadota bacterium]|jgi:uncharacterized protein YcfJ